MRNPILQHIARYLCDTPQKQARNSFAILSLQASRDMRSIATGPLSSQGALQLTDLRRQRTPKTQIFAENRRLSQIHPFSWKFQHLEGAGNRRFSQKTKDFRRKPQEKTADWGPSPQVRHLELGPRFESCDANGLRDVKKYIQNSEIR